MNRRQKSSAAVLAAAVALLVPGCGQQQAEPQAVNHAAPARPAVAEHVPSTSPSPAAPAKAESAESVARNGAAKPRVEPAGEVPVENVPTELPPGDPGLDAPPAPDPGVPADDHEHDQPARTTVPTEALLDGETVSMVLGGDWQQQDLPQPVTASGAVAERTTGFAAGEPGTGTVVQTVATHRSLGAADHAVDEAARNLTADGWSTLRNPRLGTASVTLQSADGSQTAVVISAEAVTVTLVGSGDATATHARWASLLDLALGSSCAAAPHGCH